jgi:aminopeptidase N
VEKARAIVNAYMTAPDTVDAAMAGIALKVSAQNGDSALYDKYIAQLKTSRTPEEYHYYLGAIGAFPDLALVKRAFEFALSPEVKSQDIFLVLDPLRYPDTQAAAWELFKANFSAIMAKAGPAFSGDFAHAAEVFCDAQLRDDAREFFTAQKLPASDRALQNSLDAVNACIELRSLQQANLSKFLN